MTRQKHTENLVHIHLLDSESNANWIAKNIKPQYRSDFRRKAISEKVERESKTTGK